MAEFVHPAINYCSYGEYEIVDVSIDQHEQIEQFMLEHFRSHKLLQILKVQQEPGIENEFLKIVKHILRNDSSLIVVDKERNEIKGAALLMWMTQEWHSWIELSLIITSERFRELYDMVRWCFEQDALHSKNNSSTDSLHIFSFYLCQELEDDKDFSHHFFRAICETARLTRMPRVTYMSLNKSSHERMELAGFSEVVRVMYSLFALNQKRPFDGLRNINEMYGVFYEKKVEPLLPFEEMEIRHPSHFGTKEHGNKGES